MFGGDGPTQYSTEEVDRGNLTVTVSATGKLAPTNQVQVGSELSGLVETVTVDVNDRVVKGQPLAVMEAMKMEHTIAAPGDGTVAELLYAPGDQVAEGAELLRLAA